MTTEEKPNPHPSAREMARKAFALDDELADFGPFYQDGALDERARLAAYAAALAGVAAARARSLITAAVEPGGAVTSTQEIDRAAGAAEALNNLAAELLNACKRDDAAGPVS